MFSQIKFHQCWTILAQISNVCVANCWFKRAFADFDVALQMSSLLVGVAAPLATAWSKDIYTDSFQKQWL
jgi:hypothetical protein